MNGFRTLFMKGLDRERKGIASVNHIVDKNSNLKERRNEVHISTEYSKVPCLSHRQPGSPYAQGQIRTCRSVSYG